MTIFQVKSATELTTALSKSQDGDVIQLASGSYGKITLNSIQISGNVTITSADPQNPAVVNGLLVKNSSGLTFSNLDFYNNVEGLHNAFQVLGSKDIALDHLTVHGPANLGSGLESALMMVRSSSNVTVSNSEFYNGWHGLSMLDNTGLTVANNSFHDLRTDGVRGGGNSDLVITKNMFTDFYPATDDHPDAIQLWTNNTTTSATNITITDNLIVRGDGSATQGIFMRDITGSLPFQNVTISGNIIAGGRYNGIAVEHVASGTISNNIIAGFVGERSWIRADNSTNLTVTGNSSTFYSSMMKSELGVNGNTLIAESSDSGSAWVTKWLSLHSSFSSAWSSTDTSLLKYLGLAYDTSLIGGSLPTLPSSGATTDTTTSTPVVDTSTSSPAPVVSSPAPTPSYDGDNTYFVRSASDTVVEGLNGGKDLVRAYIDYTLGANVEDLRLEVAGLTGTGNALANRIVGSDGVDKIFGMDGDDLLQGRDGDDYIAGGNGNDDVRGDNGNDKLFGDAGNDELYGGAGNDQLNGGTGDDILHGGAGNDVLTGGAGKDVFRFRTEDFATNTVDEITDFQRGVDKVQLNLIDLAGGGDFKFIDKKAFSHVVGELRYQVSHGSAYVQGDLNGDGKADFTIKVDNVTKLAASDFLL